MRRCVGHKGMDRIAVGAVLLWAGTAAAQRPAGEKPFLWELRSDTSTSYLMGSLHAAKPDIYPLHDSVYEAFDAVPVLVVEADVENVNPARLSGIILGRAMDTTGRGLESRLSRESLKSLKAVVKKHGIGMEVLNRFEPWYVSQLVTVMELARLGIDPEQGIEKHLLTRGRDTKEIIELEGLEAQLAFLDSFTDREQDLMLQYTLRDLDNMADLMDEIGGAWKAGDPDRLDALLNGILEDSKGLEVVYEKLFTERNRTMGKKILEFLATKRDYFIVVGAGHLVGDQGLLKSLAKRGIKVRQVETATADVR